MHPGTPSWLVLTVFAALVAAAFSNDESGAPTAQKKDSATIRMVMQKAMRDGLAKKVAGGTATGDEHAQLLVLFTALAGCDPPKGDAKSWNEKTAALVTAVSTRDPEALKSACNCAACHKEHK